MAKILEGGCGNDGYGFHGQENRRSAARRSCTDFAGLVLSHPNFRMIHSRISILCMMVQVEGFFDLRRFCF
ncbi:MAG: hypothetical protein J6K72_09235 [Clostridia bacterium]|nr:hypothetical protein [Clostridia bacterium]